MAVIVAVTSIWATSAATTTAAMSTVLVVVPLPITSLGGLGAMATALVGLHAAADGLGGDTSANLNIGLFNTEAGFNRTTAATTVWGCQHPLAIGLCEFGDGNNADAGSIVTAVSGAKANTPTSLEAAIVSNCKLIGGETNLPSVEYQGPGDAPCCFWHSQHHVE